MKPTPEQLKLCREIVHRFCLQCGTDLDGGSALYCFYCNREIKNNKAKERYRKLKQT